MASSSRVECARQALLLCAGLAAPDMAGAFLLEDEPHILTQQQLKGEV